MEVVGCLQSPVRCEFFQHASAEIASEVCKRVVEGPAGAISLPHCWPSRAVEHMIADAIAPAARIMSKIGDRRPEEE